MTDDFITEYIALCRKHRMAIAYDTCFALSLETATDLTDQILDDLEAAAKSNERELTLARY